MIGIAGAVGANALLLAALLTMHGNSAVPAEEDPGFAAIVTASLDPPPPEPDAVEEGAAAEPSRGDTAEPSRPEPERPLPVPTPAQPAPDAGAGAASGAGAAAGSGAGTGGTGTGSGSGVGGAGRGSGTVTPPVRIAGALTDADYRRVRPPDGARGTVVIGFTVTTGGQVEGCRVERSSGYQVLDSATCRLVTERFRFRPARDAAGRAVAWTLRTDFTWVPR
jgi:protein TonB